MSWAAFYFACFVVGLALTLVSLVLGSVHLHIPHLHFGAGHAHAGAQGTHAQVPLVNFATMVAFLVWFGATGYVLTHFHPIALGLSFAFACLGGITGLLIVFWFLSRLVQHDNTMQSADYDMVGVLGRITVPIRAGGTGEIVYSQMGRRFCGAARSDTGVEIGKGSEVVVTRHERGVAYVRRWEELEDGTESGQAKAARP